MKILFTKQFSKDLDHIRHDTKLKKNLLHLIDQIKQTDALVDQRWVRETGQYVKVE